MSGELSIDWDVKQIQATIDALHEGVEKGLEDTGDSLLTKGKDKAEIEVSIVRRIWTTEVLESFEKAPDESAEDLNWEGAIVNPVKHADVVDRGLAPAGEIPGSNPSVQDIMPWVVSKLSPASFTGNTAGWDEDTKKLADEYSPGYVITAFAVRNKLDKQGYPGIHFTETTESYMKQIGTPMLRNKVVKHLRKELEKVGD